MASVNNQGKEFFDALELLEREKGIPTEYMLEKIKNAITIAVKKDAMGGEDNIVELDPVRKKIYVAVRKTVMAEVEYPSTEITVEEAWNYRKGSMIGDVIEIPMETKAFGRIAAMSAQRVIRQAIRAAVRGQLLAEYEIK